MASPPKKRLRDIALLVPIGGLLLFLPPYVQIFDHPSTLFGIPLLHVYIFSAWAIGIAITAVIARHIARTDYWPDADKNPSDET